MNVVALIEGLGRPADAARILGVSSGHIADLKSGRRNLSIRMAARVEEATGRRDVVAAVVREKTAA